MQYPLIRKTATTVPEETLNALMEAVGWLNGYLEGQKWVAGTESPTLADIFLLNTMSGMLVRRI